MFRYFFPFHKFLLVQAVAGYKALILGLLDNCPTNCAAANGHAIPPPMLAEAGFKPFDYILLINFPSNCITDNRHVI